MAGDDKKKEGTDEEVPQVDDGQAFADRLVQEGLPVDVVMVECGGGCGKEIHAPRDYAALMKKMGTPPICGECRARKGQTQVSSGELRAPGEAPTRTTLTVTRTHKADAKTADEIGYLFKLVPGRRDQGRPEVDLYMEFHLALLKFISSKAREAGLTGKAPPKLQLPGSRGPMVKPAGSSLINRLLDRATRGRRKKGGR